MGGVRAALVASQQTLDDVWTSVRDLPLSVEQQTAAAPAARAR